MAISAAHFTDINETTLKFTYDDGRTADFPPAVVGNRRFDEMTNQPFVPTAFLAVAGRVPEARGIAIGILQGAANASTDAIAVASGGFNFDVNQRLREDVEFYNDGSNATELEDNTGVVRTLTDAQVVTLITAWKAARKVRRDNKVAEVTAVNAAVTVTAIDALLAASSFGVLGPVYT